MLDQEESKGWMMPIIQYLTGDQLPYDEGEAKG